MLGFWRKSAWPAAGEPEGPAPTPNMREPFRHSSGSDAAAVTAPLWPSLFSSVPRDAEAPCVDDEASAAETTSSPKDAEVLQLRPAWVQVGAPAEGEEEEEEEEMEHGMEFVGSYFLEDDPGMLRNRLLYPSCSSSGVAEEAGLEGGGSQDQGRGQAGGGGTQQVEMISLEELARLRGECL